MYKRILDKAIALQSSGKHDEAIAVFDAVVGQKPDDPYSLYCAGTSFLIKGLNGIAMSLMSQAIQLSDKKDVWYPNAWNNFATALKREGHTDLAVKAFTAALKVDPNDSLIWANYSGMYVNQGNPDECIRLSRHCLDIDPYQAQAGNHLALALLEKGELEEGFRWYNSRLRLSEFHHRKYPGPLWDGERVDSLVVHGEQGVGDEIMFCSLIPEVKKRVGKLVIECSPKLVETFKRSFGVPCYPDSESLLKNESPKAWVPMGSLPGIFKAHKPLEHSGYLKADPVKVEKYKAQFPGPRIGLSWRGGTKMTHWQFRNFEIPTWKKLTDGNKFISVQYGEDWGHEIAEMGLEVPKWENFDEHMALIASCDLVISVCNTTVHMAGALNVPCWCLVPSKPAWRYGMTGERMHWYPSVKLYRQKDSWNEVIEQLRSDLETYQRSLPGTKPHDAPAEGDLRDHRPALRLVHRATG